MWLKEWANRVEASLGELYRMERTRSKTLGKHKKIEE